MKTPPSSMPVVIEERFDGTYPFTDLSEYEATLVFRRQRRLSLDLWNRALATHDPDKPLHYIEVGSQEGSATLWFLEHKLAHSESTITAIDIFFASEYETLCHNIAVCDLSDKVRIYKGKSGEVLRTLPLYSFDAAYIDGHHGSFNVIEDAILCWRLLKQGGVLIFDDYAWESREWKYDRPKPAIDFFLSILEGKYDLILKDKQVAIRKTIADNASEEYRSPAIR